MKSLILLTLISFVVAFIVSFVITSASFGSEHYGSAIPALPEDGVLYHADVLDCNWEKGLNWGRIFAAMMRHGWAWWSGEKADPIDGQHHLASVAWCAFALMEYEQTHTELDDRMKKEPPFKKLLRPQWCKLCRANWTNSATDEICSSCLDEQGKDLPF